MKNSLEGLSSWFALAKETDELKDGLTRGHAIQKKEKLKKNGQHLREWHH